MKKPIIHEFDPVIYPLKLWVASEFNVKAIQSLFETKEGKELNFEISNDVNAVTFNRTVVHKKTRDWGALVAINSEKDLGARTISHEATHATRFIWDHLNEDSPGIEADAYLVGWIADCIEKVLKNKV